MATYSVQAHVENVDRVKVNYLSDFYKRMTTHMFIHVLPSPDSEGFVGDGEGRFPLGGLSDTPDSLEETRKKKKNL